MVTNLTARKTDDFKKQLPTFFSVYLLSLSRNERQELEACLPQPFPVGFTALVFLFA
jgi:hypothetical protein